MMQQRMLELQSLCSRVTSGGTPLRTFPAYFNGGTIPWIKTGEVKQGFIQNAAEHITELGLENSSAKLIPANSLIVAMYGDGDTAGNVAVNRIPVTTNQACCNFVVDEQRAHYLFLYYYLKANYQNLVNLKLGGSQQNLNASTLKRFPVPDIELAVQRKIAALLYAYDDLIANNQRRIALLESMAEEIYREWFVRMRFPGHETAGHRQGMPSGWQASTAAAMIHVQGGGTPNTKVNQYWDGEIPFFSPKDSHEGAYCLQTEQHITELGLENCASRLFPKDTIFITARGTVGNLVLAGEPMAMNQSCYALIPKIDKKPYFVFTGLKCAVNVIKGVSNSGVFDNVVMDTFKIIPLINPGAPLRDRYNEVAEPIYEQSLMLRRSNIHLRATRDALLPRLISGKLRVDALDIQFPPSMQQPPAEAAPRGGAIAS
ncbi:restriction endonuclease subunit S [Delftia acidovorans]